MLDHAGRRLVIPKQHPDNIVQGDDAGCGLELEPVIVSAVMNKINNGCKDTIDSPECLAH
jgi:hypothetical protein